MTTSAMLVELGRVIARGGGLDSLVGELRRRAGGPVAFMDLRGSLLASSPSRAIWPVDELLASMPHGGQDVAGHHAVPLLLDDEPVGLLVARANDVDGEEMEFASVLASLELARLQSELAGRRQLAGQVLEDVFSGRSRGAAARDRLASIGIELSSRLYVVVAGRSELPSRRVRERPWSLHALLGGGGDPYVRATIDGGVVLVVPEHAATAVAEQLVEHLRAVDPRAAVGVGPSASDAVSLTMSYHQARAAASRGAGIRTADPLNLGQFLLGAADTDPVREMCVRALAPLVEHDRRTSSELLPSLLAFLVDDGSIVDAAQRLFVHRNTLRYRLGLIQQLTGWSPLSFEGRMHFWIATRTIESTRPSSPTPPEPTV